MLKIQTLEEDRLDKALDEWMEMMTVEVSLQNTKRSGHSVWNTCFKSLLF